MLYMARFGYRRGKGNFAKTFGRDVDGNTKAPTIADAAQGLTDRADQNFERFDDEVGQSVLGDLLLAWCLENRKHSEGHHEQVQRIYPTHYLASWVDLPKMAVNLRGVPELLTVLLADQNDGEWLQHGGKGGFPLAVSHQDNSLLNLFGRHVSIRGQHASDLTSDTFVDESADDIGIDELLVIRLAQACESAPLRVQGAQGIENRHPLAKRAANAFRKDLAVFIEVYGRSVPRQAFLQMWEVGVALGMTNILLSTARLLNDWEHDGRVTGTSRQEAWPLFADASQGQDKALRDLSEASMTECLRRYEQLPVTMMILRVLGERVPKDRKLGGSLPNLLPDSTAFIDLLGEIYHESHERSDALLDKFHEDCLDLAQVLEEEAEEPLIVEQLKDGTTNPIRRLSEALVVLMGDKLQRSKFLTALDSALMTDQPNYPSFLPGLKPDETFVFADTLGFHAVAMVPVDDTEPKATVAVLGRLLGGDESTAPSVGKSAAQALSEEMHRYLQLHPDYRRIRVHALRAGDAMPVARALGQTLKTAEEQDENAQDRDRQLCYDLDLYSDSGQSDAQSGRFLATTAERRRSGAGAVPEQDRWLLESVTRPGGVSLPRLRWARRTESKPHSAAHVSIAFDVFTSRVECRKQADLPEAGVLEAHGLMLMPSRIFAPEPTPHWLSFVPAKPDGEKHPVTAILTRRQINLHAKILQATARHLGGGVDDWPVLVTEVSPAQAKLLQDLHGLADWVITADRNAGIEYFDSPKDLPKVYESYIIDCVPERDDLGFMQMITSTASFDEVVRLLDDALGEMGLSASPRNCQYLLNSLKAISGRLALRDDSGVARDG